MTKLFDIKRLLIALTLFSLLLTVPVALMQEEEGAEEPAAEAVEDGGEEAAEAEADGEEAAEAEEEGEEAAEGGNPLTPLGINTGFLIAQIINFLLIFAVLYTLMWKPLSNMLDARSERIRKGLEDANEAANARRNAEAEAESIMTEARADAQRQIEEGRERGEELARSIEQEARNEAEQIRTEARARANEERDRQLGELRGQVAAIAMAAAQRIVGEGLDEARQQEIVNNFFARLPDGIQEMTGSVEVISAMPLSDAEQNRIKGEIGSNDVTFTVDPAILGGLVIRSEQRVIDGSVSSDLSNLAARLR